jgi:hypothetical protein
MISDNYNLDNEWGWFIDIETNNNLAKETIYNYKNNFKSYKTKKDGDEYEYYWRIYNKNDNNNNDNKNDNNNNKCGRYFIINLGSTTFLTVFLTYLIVCFL